MTYDKLRNSKYTKYLLYSTVFALYPKKQYVDLSILVFYHCVIFFNELVIVGVKELSTICSAN